jgi:dipeptidyl aminopeptidase/acylaminoacyl peptidase
LLIVKPSDLALVRVPGVPALSPDGRTAVVPVRRIDVEADEYTAQLWVAPTDASQPPRRLTHGWHDSAPRFSPDGRWLAFLRAERGDDGTTGKPQIWVMPVAGGEPRRVTDHPLGAERPAWSPDSARLAYNARVPEAGRYGTDEARPAGKEPPRRITRLSYRLDQVGFTLDRPRHVFVVDPFAEHPEPEQVTEGGYDDREVDWSPSGDLLTFASARHDDYGCDLRVDLWVCHPDGSGLRALTSGGFSFGQPVFGPDGATVYAVGRQLDATARRGVCRSYGLFAVATDACAPRRLTDAERYNLAEPGGQIAMAPDGVLFPNENRGAVELLRVPFDGGAPQPLLSGERQVMFAAGAADVVVAGVAGPGSWGELVVRDPDGGERVLSDWGAGFDVEIRPQEEISASAPDGYPVHGWVVRPAGEGPHPVLLMIHGGPFTQYGWHLFDEAQVYAGAGYAVVMGNPRGSSGYGEAHGRAIMNDVGERSAADLLALLDAALKSDDLDSARVGVLGGSHGGFMTTWLAGNRGERFKAAISERAVNAVDSFTGSSDIGWFFADDLYGPDRAGQERQSPLTYADRIDIPMLIIHSEQDWRCPVEQAQRLYVALRRRGVPVELLLFPGEGHELSRSGVPSHRVARFEAILDWWRRYL